MTAEFESTNGQAIADGFCECGCGERTNLAPQNHTAKGWVKGQPVRFLRSHWRRTRWRERYEIRDCGYRTPCWVWTGKINDRGRPVAGEEQNAARFVWRYHNGPVPQGLELDHLCCNRVCVNPDHLEPVTKKENNRRHTLYAYGRADGLGGAIQDARHAADLTQRELATRVGVSRETVQNWERGRWEPSAEHQAVLEDVLGGL